LKLIAKSEKEVAVPQLGQFLKGALCFWIGKQRCGVNSNIFALEWSFDKIES
jgi:hypothetical protein